MSDGRPRGTAAASRARRRAAAIGWLRPVRATAITRFALGVESTEAVRRAIRRAPRTGPIAPARRVHATMLADIAIAGVVALDEGVIAPLLAVERGPARTGMAAGRGATSLRFGTYGRAAEHLRGGARVAGGSRQGRPTAIEERARGEEREPGGDPRRSPGGPGRTGAHPALNRRGRHAAMIGRSSDGWQDLRATRHKSSICTTGAGIG